MIDYETLRQFADSFGLVVTAMLFLTLCAWPFRPSARERNRRAAHSILEDTDDGE